MSGQSEQNETYLGDGVYASYDGFQIRLRAPRMEGDHEVFLEPLTLSSLLRYAKIVFGSVKTGEEPSS